MYTQDKQQVFTLLLLKLDILLTKPRLRPEFYRNYIDSTSLWVPLPVIITWNLILGALETFHFCWVFSQQLEHRWHTSSTLLKNVLKMVTLNRMHIFRSKNKKYGAQIRNSKTSLCLITFAHVVKSVHVILLLGTVKTHLNSQSRDKVKWWKWRLKTGGVLIHCQVNLPKKWTFLRSLNLVDFKDRLLLSRGDWWNRFIFIWHW